MFSNTFNWYFNFLTFEFNALNSIVFLNLHWNKKIIVKWYSFQEVSMQIFLYSCLCVTIIGTNRMSHTNNLQQLKILNLWKIPREEKRINECLISSHRSRKATKKNATIKRIYHGNICASYFKSQMQFPWSRYVLPVCLHEKKILHFQTLHIIKLVKAFTSDKIAVVCF